ncbi:MAG: hypothetical protein U0790_11595 [Isosphaeraceae bacterium]
MKSTSGRNWTTAFAGLLLLWSCQPTFAAPQRDRPTDRERFGQLIALRSRPATGASTVARPMASGRIDDPYSKQGVDAFNRRVLRQGRIPPRIPPSLLINPRPVSVEQTKSFREAYILSLYRFRGLRQGGNAGGVFFTPPSGTPYFPVSPVNIFNYFPVYRVP